MMTVLRLRSLLVLIFTLCLSQTSPTFAQAADDARAPVPQPAKDVRIVVDISGSMKESDPKNLRQPAVRLLARMLPDNAHSGVWTFGQYVNMLVQSDDVSPDWRENAVKQSSKINSVALRTNIGKALEVASDDFYGDRRFENTHFILLTDGVVDISEDAAVNARERTRILDAVVERIRERGATIHTIALSENADLALLERLAVETGGTFSVAPDADALNRVFAETLNAAAPQPEVPIKDNGFRVGDDVSEFTALIFHDEGGKPLALRNPDGKAISVDNKPDNVRWYAEGQYDLITVTKPAAGQWKIDGQLGEQSRVTVVSDLRMAVSPLPSFFYTGQSVPVEAAFYEKDKRVTNPDFLGVLSISLTLKTEDGRSGTKSLSGEVPPADGVYSDTIEKLSEPGTYELTLSADGKTFARQFSGRLTLRPPVSVSIHGTGQGDDSRYSLDVRPEHPDLDRSATMVGVQVQAPGSSEAGGFDTIPFDSDKGVWHHDIVARDGSGDYTVTVRVQGKTTTGQMLSFTPPPFTATFPRQSDDAGSYASLSAAAVTGKGTEGDSDSEPSGDASEPLMEPDDTASADVATDEEPAIEPPDELPATTGEALPATEDEPVSEPIEPELASEPVIDSPIDTTQVEEPTPAEEPATPVAESPVDESAESVWSNLPVWVWGAGGGVLAVAAIAFAVMRARRKDAQAEPKAGEESESAEESAVEEPVEEAPPVVDSAVEEEPEAALEPEPEPESEPEPEPPVATETADFDQEQIPEVEPEAEDVPVLDATEKAYDDSVSGAEPAEEGWPDVDEIPDEDLSGPDEAADDIERFLEEARRDDADLQAAEEDILTEAPGEGAAEDDDYMLEDFDLSDIDDLPDIEDDDGADEKTDDPDQKRSE